jgi:hypothetical protein
MAVSNQQILDYLAQPNLSDAAIAAAMDEFKVTPEQMALATGMNVADVQSRYDAAVAPLSMQSIANAPGVGSQGIGLNFSGQSLAPDVIPTAQPAYFQQNPDVAAAFQQNSYGLTPEQFAQTHFEKFGVNEQRAAPAPPSRPQTA